MTQSLGHFLMKLCLFPILKLKLADNLFSLYKITISRQLDGKLSLLTMKFTQIKY